MKALVVLVALLAVIYGSIPCVADTSSPLLDQASAVGDVTVRVSVISIGRNHYAIHATFKSSTYPVGCLSAYKDLKYDLRDEAGRIVPVDAKAIETPQAEGQMLNHVTADMVGKAPNCSTNAPSDTWNTRAWLSTLYPDLGPGKYTLHVTFAPHGLSGRADFPPVPIVINKL